MARKFPSYTIAQLEDAVALYEAGNHPNQANTDAAHIEALKAEIVARKSGASVARVTPQLAGGMIIKAI